MKTLPTRLITSLVAIDRTERQQLTKAQVVPPGTARKNDPYPQRDWDDVVMEVSHGQEVDVEFNWHGEPLAIGWRCALEAYPKLEFTVTGSTQSTGGQRITATSKYLKITLAFSPG
jgi:hypothetical protein